MLNIVQGDKEAVHRLLELPHVSAVSSVGSTPVARHIYESSAWFGKRVQAFGGAKNHMAVMPDADMDMVADAAVSGAYGSTGQRCMAISALVTVGDAGDVLLEKVRERTERLEVGPGADPKAEMGPLVTGLQRDKVACSSRRGYPKARS